MTYRREIYFDSLFWGDSVHGPLPPKQKEQEGMGRAGPLPRGSQEAEFKGRRWGKRGTPVPDLF